MQTGQCLPWFARNAQHNVHRVAAICQKLLQLKVDAELYQTPAYLQAINQSINQSTNVHFLSLRLIRGVNRQQRVTAQHCTILQ